MSPKGTAFWKYIKEEEYLNYVQNKLNNRPRKRLDFFSPIEFLTKFGILIDGNKVAFAALEFQLLNFCVRRPILFNGFKFIQVRISLKRTWLRILGPLGFGGWRLGNSWVRGIGGFTLKNRWFRALKGLDFQDIHRILLGTKRDTNWRKRDQKETGKKGVPFWGKLSGPGVWEERAKSLVGTTREPLYGIFLNPVWGTL